MDQHAVLCAPRVLGHEVRGPRREAPALREAVVDAAGHRHVEDLDPQVRRVTLGDPKRRLVDADLLRVPQVVDAAPGPQQLLDFRVEGSIHDEPGVGEGTRQIGHLKIGKPAEERDRVALRRGAEVKIVLPLPMAFAARCSCFRRLFIYMKRSCHEPA